MNTIASNASRALGSHVLSDIASDDEFESHLRMAQSEVQNASKMAIGVAEIPCHILVCCIRTIECEQMISSENNVCLNLDKFLAACDANCSHP